MITNQRDAAAVFQRLAISLASSGIQHVIFTTYALDHDAEAKDSMHTRQFRGSSLC